MPFVPLFFALAIKPLAKLIYTDHNISGRCKGMEWGEQQHKLCLFADVF